MKKRLLMIGVIILIGFTSSQTVFSEENTTTPTSTQTSGTAATARVDCNNVKNGEEKIPSDLSYSPTLEKYNNLKTKLEEAKTEDEVTKIGNSISPIKKNPDATRKAEEEIKKMENSVEYKQAKITEEYIILINATISQGESIKKEADACGDNCVNKDIYSLRSTANAQYVEALRAEMNKKICETVKTNDCKNQATAAKEWAICVSNTVAEISRLEAIREKGRTFDVSDIFSLRNTSPDSDVEPTSFLTVTNTIAGWMITLVSSLAVTTLIIGGFLMIISGGNEGQLETGKTIFSYSLIGIIVTLMAYGIIAFIQSIFYSL